MSTVLFHPIDIYTIICYNNVRNFAKGECNIMEVTDYEELKVNAVMTHTRGFVKIQDGELVQTKLIKNFPIV